jgi:hypothetical protein
MVSSFWSQHRSSRRRLATGPLVAFGWALCLEASAGLLSAEAPADPDNALPTVVAVQARDGSGSEYGRESAGATARGVFVSAAVHAEHWPQSLAVSSPVNPPSHSAHSPAPDQVPEPAGYALMGLLLLGAGLLAQRAGKSQRGFSKKT